MTKPMTIHERAVWAAKWHSRKPWPHAKHTVRWVLLRFTNCK